MPRPRHLLPGLLVMGFLLGGCSPTPSVTSCPPPPVVLENGGVNTSDFDRIAQDTTLWAQGLVGMTEELAESCATDAGFAWRVVARDGEDFAVTADYSPTRINARIERGLVDAVSAG